LGVSGHLLRIELAERAAVDLALAEHDRPTEPRLRVFEDEEVEVPAVIVGRHTPFPIVIVAHQLMLDVDPGTPFGLYIRHDRDHSASWPRTSSCRLPLEATADPVDDHRLELRRTLLPDAMTGFENIEPGARQAFA